MISPELNASLHLADAEARRQGHDYLTVEQLLLALLDNASALEVLGACEANIEGLRESLEIYVRENTPAMLPGRAAPEPTLGFQRALQRAISEVQARARSDANQVVGADVLASILNEKDSHAFYYLRQHGVKLLDVHRFMARDRRWKRLPGATSAVPGMPARGDSVRPHAVGMVTWVNGRRWREAAAPPFPQQQQQQQQFEPGGTMIAQELEVTLHMAFVDVREKRHEFITVDHLLLALLDNPSAAEVLQACAVDFDDLRVKLAECVRELTPLVGGSEEVDTQPTLGFQRVIQRAIMHVQSTGGGKKEVTGANVLVAIFGEKDSHACYYLHDQGVTRLDVVNYIAHGIRKGEPSVPIRQSSASIERSRPNGDSVNGVPVSPAASGASGHDENPPVGDLALDLRSGGHALLSDIRTLNGHRALLRARSGSCIVLSINEADDGLTLYTQEQVDALRSESAVIQAAQSVCAAWKEDRGADALVQAIQALAATLPK